MATTTRPDQIKLLVQVGQTGLHLRRSGFAVARALARRVGPALENVGDVHFVALETHDFNHPGQQLPGPANERFALFVFLGARGFAHKH